MWRVVRGAPLATLYFRLPKQRFEYAHGARD
jgi:hypothetical protein